jgi:hypothetical protein
MTLAALLLAAPAALLPQEVPSVGSPEAQAADASFRAWLEAAAATPAAPLHVEYQFSVDLQAEGMDEDMDVSFKGKTVSDIRSLSVMRHRFEISGMVPEEGPMELTGTLMLDGSTFWLLAKSNNDEIIPERGFLAKGDQQILERVYSLYLESIPALATMAEGEMSGIGDAMKDVADWMPPSFGAYMHPATYMLSGSKALTCRSFSRVDGVVIADVGLNLEEGSAMASVMGMIEAMAAQEGGPEAQAALSNMRRMLEHHSVRVEFDEATGIPIGMDLKLDINPRDFGVDEDGRMQMRVVFEADVTRPEKLDDALFAAPKSAAQAMDVTVFLQMAEGQMRSMLAEIDGGDGDMAF